MVNEINAVEQFSINQCTTNYNHNTNTPSYLIKNQEPNSVHFKGGEKKKSSIPVALIGLGGLGFFLGSKWGPFNKAQTTFTEKDLEIIG